ncbi:hypothetical protein MKW94_020519 [Papaver nudicaule]|uniref:Uncharacterized protein n=1 Tax=Papaver nudicaule TaxID=74823 RepID=A0AA41SEV7_PAPNU|nr:hypothetical protein [Papaver nudicaule]
MTRGIHGCPTSDDPMHHSLAKIKRSSQKRPLPATKTKDNFQVQFHSQGASDVPKQKKFRRLFDLTPTRTLLSSKPGDLQVERRVRTSQGVGLKSRGPSQASSSSIPHTTDNDRHQEGPSRASSLPNFDAGVLENESRRSQASRQVSPSPENVEHSPAGSNTPAEHNAESGAPRFVKRGITRMLKALAQQPVQNLLPRVGVFNKEFIGPYASELIASLGVWTRQRENFPLSIRLFRKMPPENDHYELVPDDEVTETMLRKYMNKAYVSYRASLSTHFRETCKGDLQIALAHPPKNCENIEDWKNICEYFNTTEAKARSAKAIAAREKQVLNHTNGSQSFTRKLFERGKEGKASTNM